ncbi:hypothetical protein HMI01_13950 [Halolactibacillus miurensis]|uniref:Competence protein ComGF n=2 Tax=Halolactibacillus miurensis TaxID=306541 RepID=A0A1I6PRG3_9BACI|nr:MULTISPECIES: ComGF family competence protein [Halolactibacillus]GEM04407.1 hypothetical protein HMI01_13950 [Halolactibacillus miurensis]SFS42822.1 competence protein ComGF [Halolactibacillus miurensis]
MIELLLTIQLTMLFMMLLMMIIPYMKPPSSYQTFQVYQFMGTLEKEIQTSSDTYIINNTLYLTTLNGDLVSITHYQNFIRRQVNGQGHEILLRDVKDFTVTEDEEIDIIIKTTEEALFYDTIVPFTSR